jgi:hypothetical protein
MPSPGVQTGHGSTVVFGTSGFTAEITNFGTPAPSRPAIDVSHLGTVGSRVFIPGDLVDNGEMTLGLHFNPDELPPINGAAETITLTFKSGATWAFSGFVTGLGSANQESDNKVTQDVTIKVSGDINVTAAS